MVSLEEGRARLIRLESAVLEALQVVMPPPEASSEVLQLRELVNPMSKDHKDPHELDLTTPRLAWYKQKKWTRHQDTVYWDDLQLAQQKGFKFHQTRSNSIILYETLPAYCVPKVVVMEPGENIYQKVYVSPQLPPKISFQDDWMKDLDSEVAGSSKDSQRIHSKSKTQLPRTVRPVSEQPSGSFTQAIRKDVLFGRESTNSRTERPVDGLPSSQPELCLLNLWTKTKMQTKT